MNKIHTNKTLNQQGFTLIELLIVLVIAAILLTVAVPSLTDTLNQNRVDKARFAMATSLSLARTEAVTRGESVTLCRTDDANVCAVGATWNTGWAIVDSDGGLIKVEDSNNDGVTISYNCADSVVTFSPTGYRTSGAGATCRFQFSDASGDFTGFVDVRQTGRVTMRDI